MPRFLLLVLILILISLSPARISNDFFLKTFFIIWNVGQGQWATYVDETACHHFDMGGERNPIRRVQAMCENKENHLYVSHWDWDHISFALKARQYLKKTCLRLPPLGRSSLFKMKILEGYKTCDLSHAKGLSVQRLTRFKASEKDKKSNELSHVLLAGQKYLIPGDSSKKQEKIWSLQKSLAHTRVLLLGHHGSKTSTSEELLSRLPRAKIAVASARQARYGHPHFEVTERLRRHRVILLRTEDWGNVWFQE